MKTISTLFFSLLLFNVYSQRILLVDNTPSKPGGSHVYATLQAAIDASVANDIIHVKPSSTTYGSITITTAHDSITIYGIGLNPDKEIFQYSAVGAIYITGNNVKISGLRVTSSVFIGYVGTSANLSFENNEFEGSVYVGYSYASSNVLFRNCLINGAFTTDATRATNTVVNNCIFSGYNGNGQSNLNNGTLISHCLFFGNSSYSSFSNLNSVTIANSIFFGRSPQATTASSNSTFNNCFATQNTNNAFPTANGNSVNGTITTISGNVFADASIVPAANWDINWNPALDPVSTQLIGANAGNDGTDIGLTGGTIPFNRNAAPLPYIKSLVVPSVIKQGDNLNVTVNALGN